ncbi:hypothetical protein I41_36840 [Lacipirellula limnantheis]|uniref:DUF4177 domain-containing protein n=1 Tax=Lacipirellula limnantheis TaxID=2528024 RepID=A0A517U1J1_9BACT|nr:hypothetical protein I41_36840 [Lacipirellula limnantheis]
MRVTAASLVIAVIVVVMGQILSGPSTVGQAPGPAPTTVKCEYLARSYNELGNMNGEGAEGWELVSVVQKAPEHSGVVAYFKRPK